MCEKQLVELGGSEVGTLRFLCFLLAVSGYMEVVDDIKEQRCKQMVDDFVLINVVPRGAIAQHIEESAEVIVDISLVVADDRLLRQHRHDAPDTLSSREHSRENLHRVAHNRGAAVLIMADVCYHSVWRAHHAAPRIYAYRPRVER